MADAIGNLWHGVVSAPGFALGIVVSDDALLRIEFLAPQTAQAATTALAREVVAQLHCYLEDAHHTFDLPLAPCGTAHRNAVWKAMTAIPVGQTLSYGDVARRIGSSPRAVGAACGANPWPVVVPCHRIVGAGGWLGGFAHARDGFLPGIKRWLLAHEAGAREPGLAGFRDGDRVLSSRRPGAHPS